MPIMGITNGVKVKDMLDKSPELRISVYKQTILLQLILSALIFLSLFINGEQLESIGANTLTHPKSLVILIVTCLLFMWFISNLKLSSNWHEKLKRKYRRVFYILPETKAQYHWSILMSFAAGFGEEIIFRGFLFSQVSQLMPEFIAIVVINIIFALCHWGTGIQNALYSFGLGIIWSIIYWYTGSLWIPILTHIMVDLMSTGLGYKIRQNSIGSNLDYTNLEEG